MMRENQLWNELFDLTGRVALVTGATKGLGREIALTLSMAGAEVAICSRHGAEAQVVAGELQAITGRKVTGFEADVTDSGQVATLVERINDGMGSVDILVASAGINIRKPSMELSETEWDSIMDINVKGVFLCARAVLPEMKRRKFGRVVLLGSMLSFVSIPGRAAYAASKTALLGLTRTLALEYAADGVCVNALCPGPFETPMNLPLLQDPEKYKAFISKLPVGRWAQPREIRGIILYLCSPACSFMTGSSLVIDGGWTAQ